MDIIFIIKKLIEVDKMKALLLSDEQLKLFDYIPKPVISNFVTNEDNPNKKDIFEDEKPFTMKVYEALEAYKKITINSNFPDQKMNEKLVGLLDDEIKTVFDQAIKRKLFSYFQVIRK